MAAQPFAVQDVAHRHLLVAWQHPGTRRIEPVGSLTSSDRSGYRFRYLARAAAVPDFRSLPGFPRLDEDYTSVALFPLFAQRVMSPRRPDFVRYLDRLGLTSDHATDPMELMGRSTGRRRGDSILLFPVPRIEPDGGTRYRFLVHGVRHLQPAVERRLRQLTPGDPLLLVDEPDNPVDARAVLTTDSGGDRLGWVPDLLLGYLDAVRAESEPLVTVEHVNGPDAPPHLRLLVRLEGRAAIGYQPFSGPGWEPATRRGLATTGDR